MMNLRRLTRKRSSISGGITQHFFGESEENHRESGYPVVCFSQQAWKLFLSSYVYITQSNYTPDVF